FSSRRRHTRFSRDWSSDVCSSDLGGAPEEASDTAPVETESVVIDGSAVVIDPTGGDAQAVADALSAPAEENAAAADEATPEETQIGRAACRERGWVAGGGGARV